MYRQDPKLQVGGWRLQVRLQVRGWRLTGDSQAAAVGSWRLTSPDGWQAAGKRLEAGPQGVWGSSNHPHPIDARLFSPSEVEIALLRVPRVALVDRPLEIEFALPGYFSSVRAAASVVRSVANVPVSVRPSGDGWAARAIIRPATWAGATSVGVASVTLAGRSLPSGGLPATLRVGYNHDPAPVGAVYAAGESGDVAALLAALEEGASTEESDGVCGQQLLRQCSGPCHSAQRRARCQISLTQPLWPHSLQKDFDMAVFSASMHGHVNVVRILIAAGANIGPSRKVRRGWVWRYVSVYHRRLLPPCCACCSLA